MQATIDIKAATDKIFDRSRPLFTQVSNTWKFLGDEAHQQSPATLHSNPIALWLFKLDE